MGKIKKQKYTCLEDYPKHIQKEAFEILNEGKHVTYLKKTISQLHEGDEKAIELILLSIGSLFLDNGTPIHQQIKGGIGSGKTNLLQNTLKIVPERYIHEINNITPEYLYYKHNSLNKDYNIFILDNINPTEATISMLNVLLDNETQNKIFIESKGFELELPGKNLFFCIFNEENNIKIKTPIFLNYVTEDLDHKNNVNHDVKISHVLGWDINNTKVQHSYLVANTIFEKLIEKPIKVLNYWDIPFENEVLYNIKNYHNAILLTELTKALTFYHQKNREHNTIHKK
ncbi:MAG: hypothetical protein PHY59_00760 [Methanobacterium sp.]|nr:hypothetical protein [Methanobacterium sp.]